jgi:methylthioribose-1-phosphate isomerase
MRRPTLRWVDNTVELLDQTLLPHQVTYIRCEDIDTLAQAIRDLKVRGAPAIGLAAALGIAMAAVRDRSDSAAELIQNLDRNAEALAATRPTAVNLFWALNRMRGVWASGGSSADDIKEAVVSEALQMLEEDRRDCRAIGEHGASLLPDSCTVLTHCNAGYLATADYGTALAIVYVAHDQGKRVHVYADETRPLLQGARLTTWELQEAGIPVTLICDGMAASVMASGRVDLVITGADRIAANGDTANKIGTLGLAVLARHFDIPFYIAAPVSTIDFDIAGGVEIPIEERSAHEVRSVADTPVAPFDVPVYNPAFDVTPATLIAAIVTERGVHRPPYEYTLGALR